MWARLIAAAVLIFVFCFGYVLLFGAPYLPTMKRQVKAAIKLSGLKPGQTLLELGSGDGRVLVAAAQAGLNVVGYELNPLLFMLSYIRVRRYRKQVRVIFGNFWQLSWPACDGIYVFLLPRLMGKLEQKIRAEGLSAVPVISFAFKFNELLPVSESHGVFLYRLEPHALRSGKN